MARTRYRKGKKKDDLIKLEGAMLNNGFELKDHFMEIKLDGKKNKARFESEFIRSKKILERMNWKIKVANYSQYNEIKDILENQKILKWFHEDYSTEEEIKIRLDRGDYICIVDECNKVLAYNSGYELNGCWYGDGIFVRNEYKMYGLAPILQYYRGIISGDMVRKGVILLNNTPTIKFHRSMGWQFMDKCIDCWLKEV